MSGSRPSVEPTEFADGLTSSGAEAGRPAMPGDVRRRMSEVDTRYGRLVVPDLERDLISRFLVRFGEWAWLEVEFLAGVLPPGARVADIGAFLGTFGLGLSKCAELRSVCFVEANPSTVPLLQENVARCCTVPHQIIPALLAPRGQQPAPGMVAEADNLGSTSYASPKAAPAMSLAAAPAPEHALTLSDLIERDGPFDLIKLDVEGMELSLLRAEPAVLEVSEMTFWLECNETPASLEVASLLLGHGLRVWYVAFPAFNPENHAGSTEPIFPFAFESALLATRAQLRVAPKLALPPGCILHRIRSSPDLKQAMWTTPRFAPAEWQCQGRLSIIAVAMHAMLDETYDDYLVTPRAKWISPLARAHQQLAETREELRKLRRRVSAR